MNPEAWYVVVTMISSVISFSPAPPVIGPMTKEQCEAVTLAIEVEEVASIAKIECRQVRVVTLCRTPAGLPTAEVCPVWDQTPLTGAGQDQK